MSPLRKLRKSDRWYGRCADFPPRTTNPAPRYGARCVAVSVGVRLDVEPRTRTEVKPPAWVYAAIRNDANFAARLDGAADAETILPRNVSSQ